MHLPVCNWQQKSHRPAPPQYILQHQPIDQLDLRAARIIKPRDVHKQQAGLLVELERGVEGLGLELGVTNLEIVSSLLFFDYFSGRNSLSPTRRSLNTLLITALSILSLSILSLALLHPLHLLLHLKLIHNSLHLQRGRPIHQRCQHGALAATSIADCQHNIGGLRDLKFLTGAPEHGNQPRQRPRSGPVPRFGMGSGIAAFGLEWSAVITFNAIYLTVLVNIS